MYTRARTNLHSTIAHVHTRTHTHISTQYAYALLFAHKQEMHVVYKFLLPLAIPMLLFSADLR